MSGENGDNEDELFITPKAIFKCCRICTQCIAENKGALVEAMEAFLRQLGTQVVDAQSFLVHLDDGYKLDKEGEIQTKPTLLP